MLTFAEKLEKVAWTIAKAHPSLHLFALVRFSKLPDTWHLLISADDLSTDLKSLRYVVALLKKELTAKEVVRISQIIILPLDSPSILSLLDLPDQDGLRVPYPDDDPARATIFWPPNKSPLVAQTV